ncbi:uncharacterized protein LOC121761044 isoform X2 [Salvia splendens]|uniref:uncharacterized protein LOC121761044 isoform X2 n=1 Tax=Salvia splendens TaxID=180675 RepID=UPI001C254173|nr:uncharacterized protein LOC121761044 isoform X2 [Salvia splendens]
MEKATARKPPLPPHRQRLDEKASATAGKPPLHPHRQRMDEKASAAARKPPLLPVVKGQIGVSLPLIISLILHSHLFFPPAEWMRRPPPPRENRPSLSVVKENRMKHQIVLGLPISCGVGMDMSKSHLRYVYQWLTEICGLIVWLIISCNILQ